MPLELYSEPYRPTGGISSDGVRKVLGRPEQDQLTVLVRETVQNSWDARLPDASVDFAIEGRSLTAEQHAFLRNELLATRPIDSVPELETHIDGNELEVLIVSDRGTKGLAGSTRADVLASGPSNFVDFVFNIGRPPDKAAGGGTYGFGKTIAYLVSSAWTVVIHSRTTDEDGAPLTRVMAAALGERYDRDGMIYTGRHWWGRMENDFVAPVQGDEADRIADSLGLPEFGDQTGTNLMLLAPDWSDFEELGRGPRETSMMALQHIAEAICWNAWPKMVPEDGESAMSFSVSGHGGDVPVPTPADIPALRQFPDALRAVRQALATEETETDNPLVRVCEVRSQRPKKLLGYLGFVIGEAAGPGRESAPITGASHHVALMRRPELIVQYRSEPQLPSAVSQWAAVFKPVDSLDPAFADAEPPTHDSWNSKMVSNRDERRSVNVGTRVIGEKIREMLEPHVIEATGHTDEPLARIADRLADLMPSVSATGATKPRPTTGVGTKPLVSRTSERIVLHDEQPAVEAGFTVASTAARVEIRADVSAAINSGLNRESDPPLGVGLPEVVGFAPSSAPGQVFAGDTMVLEPSDERDWMVIATVGGDNAVLVSVTGSAMDSNGAVEK